jgi:hypothetical protein
MRKNKVNKRYKSVNTKVGLIALLFTTFSCSFCYAGSQQNADAQLPALEIAKFAKYIEQFSAKKRAHVFLIARVGQAKEDLPEGVHFTHTAIAVYSTITTEQGEQKKGYAIHNLYQLAEDPSRSKLIVDYPTDFFWSVSELKAGIAIPSAEVQQRIVEAINNNVPAKVHNQRYSLIANPFNSKRQNCTEHTLDVLNAAIYKTTDLKQLKANTRAYFQPQKLKINRFTLGLGSIFKKDIYTRDHQGSIQIATFTTLKDYLKEHKLLSYAGVITAKDSHFKEDVIYTNRIN